MDRSGNVYVADSGTSTIRQLTQSEGNWTVTTLAGQAFSQGSTDATGTMARFYQPSSLAVDNAGNIYVADTVNNIIRKITPTPGAPGVTNWVVTTLAGTAGNYGYADGMGSAAQFNTPYGVAVDETGAVYVADTLY